MNFDMIIEDPLQANVERTIERVAIRAIIMSNNRILLVHSSRGDFKFPGGGLEENESHEECLIREVREETGYIHCTVNDKVGTVTERKMDEYIDNALFEMTSHYYLCELASVEKTAQQLEGYEAELNFTPKWVTLEEAIKQNESLIERYEQNGWLRRETFVLKQLENMLIEECI
ncbi:NUDIX domain-containing protein [Mesobacillus selenatarsenatis]|uniref:MutT/nudix family protein n=1 Tax=Mesobacillus selenatarsenatis (strain DSM 18680 / JCM 14380 / FERM P-15431 / SF-1) TaxID=1321606 RepID=A0A0A8WZH4_MESS1|nr:NUDIX domain-containing protein [Mesobacillus selenatarsenatis]GAM12162.1 MutT/nudix family protein [Mesobacillus selenatarsenatis SF-1]